MDRSDQVRQVIELIEEGSSENAACKTVGISRSTFRTTALRVVSGDSYARALEALAAHQTEKIEETIADMRDGTVDAQKARVEIDARKWFASKFLPKQYGDRINVDHSGSIQQQSDEQIMARIAELQAKNDASGS